MLRTGPTVNAAHPYILAASIQADHIVELRFQLVRRAEQILLASDDEDAGYQNRQSHNNESSQTAPLATYIPPTNALEISLTKLNVTFLQFFKVTFDYDFSPVEQRQTVRNRLGAMQIVSHYDGCHVDVPAGASEPNRRSPLR